MDIKLGVQHFVTSELTGKSWNLPLNSIIEDDQSKLWLKISPSNFGLCNLLTTERLDPKKRPTLKMSPGLNYLLGERNTKVFENPKDPLFDGEEPPKKKLKKKSMDHPDAETALHIGVGDEGAEVIVKACKRATDDLIIFTSNRISLSSLPSCSSPWRSPLKALAPRGLTLEVVGSQRRILMPKANPLKRMIDVYSYLQI